MAVAGQSRESGRENTTFCLSNVTLRLFSEAFAKLLWRGLSARERRRTRQSTPPFLSRHEVRVGISQVPQETKKLLCLLRLDSTLWLSASCQDLTRRVAIVTQSFDFYHPPILADPSLRLFERRGLWAFGGVFVLAAILLLGLALRLDRLGASPRGPQESAVWRDWQKSPRAIHNLEIRELLPPAYHRSLQLWGHLGKSTRMLRLHSIVWSLLLIVVVFRLGTTYFSPSVGALAALLLAISPPLVATSQSIGPATEAAVWLALNLGCLLRAVFRRASGSSWALYLLTGVLAIVSQPLSVWVVLTVAVLAFAAGPREERQRFYGPLATHALLLALFAWIWFRSTRPVELPFPADWGLPTASGLYAVVRSLGADVFWGTRVYPSGWLWTIPSIVLVVAPLLYGGLAIRNRPTQELGAFLLMTGAAAIALILIVPRSWMPAHCPATEVLVLALAPLALWAAAAMRLGMRERARQAMAVLLIGGGLLLTPWSSRVQVLPEWAIYREALSAQVQHGRAIVTDDVAQLADFEEYLGAKIKMPNLGETLALAPTADKSLATFGTRSPIYRMPDPAASPAPLIRNWLQKNCPAKEALADDFFRLTVWTEFNPAALREAVNRQTFYDPATWETLKFVRWFGPYDPGFEHAVPTPEWIRLSSSQTVGCLLTSSRTHWEFEPRLAPDCYHVFVPLRLTEPRGRGEVSLLWTLPNGEHKRQTVTKETTGFSFVWSALVPNQKMKLTVWAPDETGTERQPPLVFLGLGLRRHFPYVVDVGAPFDDLALGEGWHQPVREGEGTYRWTNGNAHLTFYLPAAGGIGLEGRLSVECACRQPGGTASVPFEVFWDGRKIEGEAVATETWETVQLALPRPPSSGRHEVVIKSPTFTAPDPSDPKRQLPLGIMVSKVSIE